MHWHIVCVWKNNSSSACTTNNYIIVIQLCDRSDKVDGFLMKSIRPGDCLPLETGDQSPDVA